MGETRLPMLRGPWDTMKEDCATPVCGYRTVEGRSYCQKCLDGTGVARAAKRIRSGTACPKGYSWIYFIQEGNGGLIKIGRARNLRARVSTLRGAGPVEIVMLAAFLAVPSAEAALHDNFSDLRVRYEWFQPAESLLMLVDNLRYGVAPPWLHRLCWTGGGKIIIINDLQSEQS